ncbi:MAG: VOC family protein [Pseudomonadales bacterium]|nr:VOC family protein [Pseudomonadales bacterium]
MNAVKKPQYSFNHRHLVVDDVSQTVAFYEQTLGAKKIQELEYQGKPIIRLELDGLPLTISDQIQPGVGDHIGLTVDDFEAAIEELRAKDVEFVVEPADMGFAKFAFIKDAAGRTLEIIQFAKRD